MVSPADQSYELLSTSGSLDKIMASLYCPRELNEEEHQQYIYKYFNSAQIYGPNKK